MTEDRRRFLGFAAVAITLAIASRIAAAQSYPSRPVHIVVGYPAGLLPDIAARLVGQRLSDRLGQQFVIENRPGANGNIGTEIVVRAAADGYTLLQVNSANAFNATLYPKLNFDFIGDITPIACIGASTFVIVVNPSLAAKTVPEFIAYARANPNKITMASAGDASPNHIFGELFQMMTGVELIHVPYRSSYLPDLLAGQAQVAFSPISTVIEYVRAGKLRALAVTSATPSEVLPDTPPVGQFVSGYEAGGWLGIGAPNGTSPEIINKLNDAINAAFADPATKERLVYLGIKPMPMTPAEFGEFVAAETKKWGKVIRASDIKLE